jgi:hypothetical protein
VADLMARGAPAAQRLLGIYLDDHLAVLIGGAELVRRTLSETSDPEIRRFLEALLPDLEADRAGAERIARTLGRRPNALKQRLAWAAEKAGRLKLNGRVVGYTPLSRLVELEGAAAVLGASRALWRSLEHAGPAHEREYAAARAARADEHLAALEELRLAVAEVVFDGGNRRL